MMRILLLTFFYIIVCTEITAQAPEIQWQKTIGGDSTDAPFSALETFDGGFIIGGYSTSGISGDKTDASRGKSDYWIVKLDALGSIEWDKTYGGNSTDNLQAVLQTNDGGYLLGGYSESGATGEKTDTAKGSWDTWLIKIDAFGNKLWDKSYGGNEKDGLVSMMQTDDKGYLFWAVSKTDANGDKTENSRGQSDFWLVKLDSLGNIMWDKTIGGNNIDHILSVKPTYDGGYILAGFSLSGVSGERTAPNFGIWDYWIVKLDSDRNIEWDKSFGGSSVDFSMSVEQLPDSTYLIGGFSSSGVSGNKTEEGRGGLDYWVVSIDMQGNKLWEKIYGGSGAEEMRAGIKKTLDGGWLFSGFSESDVGGEKSEMSRGGHDFWIVKTDINGEPVWDKTIGGSGTEFLYSVVAVSDGSYLLSGWSNSDISGEKMENSRGSYDFWIVKTFPDTLLSNLDDIQRNIPVSLTVFPNPVSDYATIRLLNPPRPNQKLLLEIFNEAGSLVQQVFQIVDNDININRQDLVGQGIYFFRIIDTDNGNIIGIGKFIVK